LRVKTKLSRYKALVFTLLSLTIVIVGVVGVYSFYNSHPKKSTVTAEFCAYKNNDANDKMNALTDTLEEFGPSEYTKVRENNLIKFVYMSPTQNDWDGMHFVFDLSPYAIKSLTSITFTWTGGIIEPQNCDCMELWYYTDSGWAEFDNLDTAVWFTGENLTKSATWTSNFEDYIDENCKVHISAVLHVKDEVLAFAYLVTQFVELEISFER